MVKVHSLSRLPRRVLSLFASIAMMFAILPAMTLLTAAPANAASTDTLPLTTPLAFEDSDGNMVVDGSNPVDPPPDYLDWNSPTVKGSSAFVNAPDAHTVCGSEDDIFGQGTKEDDTTPTVVCQSSTPKVDLQRAYAWTQTVDSHTYLYMAWEAPIQNGANNNHIDFELNQVAQPAEPAPGANSGATWNLNRTVGDLLFDFDVTPDVSTVLYSSWTGSTWSSPVNLVHSQAAINSAVFTDPISGGQQVVGSFGEMGIDLTASGLFSDTKCTNFTDAWVKGRSSGSGGVSEMKDFIPPSPIEVTNCSPAKILKEGPNGEKLSGAHFSIAPETPGTDPDVPPGQDACVTDSTGYCLINGADPLLFPGHYTVTETQAPDGYLMPTGTDAQKTLDVPQDTDLVFTDPLGSVTVNKSDDNEHALAGAGWTLTATAGVAAHGGVNPDTDTIVDGGGSDSDGQADGTVKFDDLLTGTYTLTETTTPQGFTTHDPVTGIVISDTDGHRHITENLSDTKKKRVLDVHKTNLAGDVDIAGATFQLWIDDNGTPGLQMDGQTPDHLVPNYDGCTTGVDGHCLTPYADATWDNTYFWVETGVPWPFTVPDSNVFPPTGVEVTAANVDDGTSVTPVQDPKAALTTNASDDTNLSGTPATAVISDTATLNGVRNDASGTIYWYLFKGDTCSTDAIKALTHNDSVGHVAVSGITDNTGTFGPVETTVSEAGTYHWIAIYETGNLNGDELVGSCDDTNEQVVVSPAQPTLVTVATPNSDTVDGTINDTATVSGLAEPLSTGDPKPSVTFTVYTDSTCSTTAPGPHSWTVAVTDNGDGTATATSGDYQLTNEFGTYYWKASFDPGSDTNNQAIAANDCGKVDEQTGDSEVSHAPVLDQPVKYNTPGSIGPGADSTDTTVSIFPAGNQISYLITVHNSGDATMKNVTVTDHVSSLADYNQGSAACDSSGDQTGCAAHDGSAPDLSWTFDLAAGGTAQLTFSVTVDPSDANGDDITNFARVYNGDTESDTPPVDNPVAYPVLAITKDSTPQPREDDAPGVVAPGDTIHYDVTVTNSGDAAAEDVLVTDTVPSGTTYKAGTIGCTGTCTPDDSGAPDLAWTVTVPAAGEGGDGEVHVTFDVTVNADDANGFIVANHAHYAWPSGSDTEPLLQDDSRTITHIVEFPILHIVKTANPPSGSIVQRGDQIDYTINVTNTGLAPAPDTVVTDTLPANVTVIDSSFNVKPDSIANGVITWTVNVPAADEGGPGQVVLTYSVTVNSDAPEGSDQVNTVDINGQCDPEAGDVCETHHHVPTGDLTLVKFVNGQQRVTAKYGDTLTYTFDAATTGKLDQTNVHVSDVVPAGTTYVDGSAGCTDAGQCDATYDKSTNTVTWSLGDMAAGTTRHLVFKVTIDTPQADANGGLPPETIFNFGVIGSTETQDTPSNKVRADIVAVLGEKVVKPPKVLPFTGAVIPLRAAGLVGLLMIAIGAALSTTRRRRRTDG